MRRFHFLRGLTALLLVLGFYPAFAEEMTREEILAKFHEDVGLQPDDLRNFMTSVQPVMGEMQQEMMKKMQEIGPKSMTPTIQAEIMIDAMANVGTKVQAEAKKNFTGDQYQKLNLRMFQLMQGTLDGCAKSDDVNVVIGGMGSNIIQLAAGPPDFLELTADQKDQIRAIQRDVAVKSNLALEESAKKSMEANPESQKKLGELYAKLKDAMPEEKETLYEQIQQIQNERMLPAMAELKKLLADGKARFLRVLTDRQRAKYEQVMADIPDYLWQRMPQNAGKDRPWQPGLGSWIPGMGAPEGFESMREAKPQKPERDRRFPGSE